MEISESWKSFFELILSSKMFLFSLFGNFSAKPQKSVLTVARGVPESAGKTEHKDQNLYCSLQNTKNSEFLVVDLIELACAAAAVIITNKLIFLFLQCEVLMQISSTAAHAGSISTTKNRNF